MPDAPRDRAELVRLMAGEFNGGTVRATLKAKWAIAKAAALLSAIEAAGCVVVPKEATEQMLHDADIATWDPSSDRPYIGESELQTAWRAMIAASPFREGGDG